MWEALFATGFDRCVRHEKGHRHRAVRWPRAHPRADAHAGEWSGDGSTMLLRSPCLWISESEGKEDGEELAEKGEDVVRFLGRRRRLSPASAGMPVAGKTTLPPPSGL